MPSIVSGNPEMSARASPYQSIANVALMVRFFRTMFALFGISYIAVVLFQLRISFRISLNILWTFISFRNIFYTLIIYTFSLPLLFARKANLHAKRAVKPNLFGGIVYYLGHWGTYAVVGFYILSAISIATSYYGLHGERYLSAVFVYMQGRNNAPRINEKFVYAVSHIIFLGVVFSAKRMRNGRDCLMSQPINQSKLQILRMSLSSIAQKSFRFSLVYLWRFTIVFFVFGGVLYRLTFRVFSTFSSLADDSYRWSRVFLDPHMILRSFIAGGMATAFWYTLDELFDIFFTEPLLLTGATSDPNRCLVSGLRLENKPIMKHFAFYELWLVMRSHPHRRIALFEDIMSTPTMWHQVSEECFKVVFELITAIERERVHPPAKKPEKEQKEPTEGKKELPPSPNRIKPVVADIFAGGKKGGDLRQRIGFPPESGSNAPSIPEGQPPTVATSKQQQGASISPEVWVANLVLNMRKMLERYRWGKILFAETGERQAQRVFSNWQLVIWAAQVLSRLTAASYHEDQYGVVQRDIPRVLECLLTCLMATEEFLQRPPDKRKRARVVQETHAVVTAIEACIYEIVVVFYESLGEMRFPPRIAQRLQVFMDFKE
ncbi:uncharacterized protein VTP21DRAFT_5737 [Calcarisporiella thermophila]|uniref:uncharacterized protein n=1 Tax=Calcarisporiella thermophila TaxID=911321 RepID=UPI003743C995